MTAAAARIVVDVVARPGVDLLSSVPPERERALWRGHDPAASLARALGREWALPCERLLRRRGGSSEQKGLSAEARRTNLEGVFRSVSRPRPRVGLIDDVYTTGATASAAASELLKAGATRVEVVTFARVIQTRGTRHGVRSGGGSTALESKR